MFRAAVSPTASVSPLPLSSSAALLGLVLLKNRRGTLTVCRPLTVHHTLLHPCHNSQNLCTLISDVFHSIAGEHVVESLFDCFQLFYKCLEAFVSPSVPHHFCFWIFLIIIFD